MLTIRAVQLAMFEAEARQRFDRWLLEHVHQYWPDRVSLIGDDSRLDAILDEAIKRARQFGIERSANLARYVNLVMLLGIGFPEDSRIPWAGDFLRSPLCNEDHKLLAIKQLLGTHGLDEAPLEWGWP